MSYINSIFKDQVWNKDFGYHDAKKKLEGKTMTNSQRDGFGVWSVERMSSEMQEDKCIFNF